MWCANCQDDVATEISADGQAIKCITCGDQVRQVFAPSLHPETKSARDLLQKWAEEQKQQLGNVADSSTEESSQSALSEKSTSEDKSSETNEKASTTPDEIKPLEVAAEKKSKPKFRIDAAHKEHVSKKPAEVSQEPEETKSVVSEKAESQSYEPIEKVVSEKVAVNLSTQHYHDHSSHEQAPAPHFDVVAASKKAKARPGRSEAIWGQLMAYAGVGVLTVGTVMVLWGYFGMVEQYASTGWLLSTAGQMLLLLGIVTLVSGGMQQTTHEVTERIEYLGGRMIRIEQSTDQLLKGPHFRKQRTGSGSVVQADNNSNST
ncbi:hypothetical protein OAF74_00430 [bacterium]|jgi:hypothetical protein|nr:hypothetical protein [bacterium]